MNLATHRWTVRLTAEFGHADITPELQTMVVALSLDDRERVRELVAVLVGS